jgi:hypothetical protein
MTASSEHPGPDDVEGHARQWSDETLKQGIEEVERALAGLRELQPTEGDEDDVQGHTRLAADKGLEQPIGSLRRALAILRPAAASS